MAQVLECLYSMHKALDSILEPNMVEFICILVLRRKREAKQDFKVILIYRRPKIKEGEGDGPWDAQVCL